MIVEEIIDKIDKDKIESEKIAKEQAEKKAKEDIEKRAKEDAEKKSLDQGESTIEGFINYKDSKPQVLCMVEASDKGFDQEAKCLMNSSKENKWCVKFSEG